MSRAVSAVAARAVPADALPPVLAPARRVADAVLYEGYVLYPYRASATKNQLRWQFGVLAPPAAVAGDPAERSHVEAQVVVDGDDDAELTVVLRCLQVRHRRTEQRDRRGRFVPVPDVTVDGATVATWDEGVEHDLVVGPVRLGALARTPRLVPVHLAAGRDVELLGMQGSARVVRRRWAVHGRLLLRATRPAGHGRGAVVTVRFANATRWRAADGGQRPADGGRGPDGGAGGGRDRLVRRSFVGTHLLLGVAGGSLASAVDPPDELADLTATCRHAGIFPVLVGGTRWAPAMLLSPIVLSDDPQVAPESPGDMFDATEIDEILALRVVTLTDEEKRQARATDERAAAVIDRCERFDAATWAALHGTMRSPAPVPWWDPDADADVDPATDRTDVDGVPTGAGDKVVLHPRRSADAQDLFLAGRTATVAAVLRDVDGGVHLAVVVDDDPASELHEWYGRFRYFSPDELARADRPAPPRRVLVAGIGNVFLGDDGFGAEVARALGGRRWPDDVAVEVEDVGIRGVHLAHQLLEGYDLVVLVDALAGDETPGTVTVMEPSAANPSDPAGAETPGASLAAGFDAHGLHPEVVLGLARRLGAELGRVVVVGCQPALLEPTMGLSPEVAAAVPVAVDAVVALVDDLAARSAVAVGATGAASSRGGHRPPQRNGLAVVARRMGPEQEVLS